MSDPSIPEVVRWYTHQHLSLRRPTSRKTLSWICNWWAVELPPYMKREKREGPPTATDVHGLLSECVRMGRLSATTANLRRRVLNRCLEVARVRWPLLVNIAHSSGVPKIPEPAKTVRGILQPLETWPRLIAILPGPEGRLFASIQRRQGLRVGEVRGLMPADVLWNTEELFVQRHREADQSEPGPLKTDTCAARLPMHPEVRALMREVMSSRMRSTPKGALGKFLFPWWRATEDSLMSRMREVSPADFPKRVVGERGGDAWHVLRHTYGTELVEAGLPVDEVQLAMRHASITSTQNYIASIRGRKIPTAALRNLWAAQQDRENGAEVGASGTERLDALDVKQHSAHVSRLHVPQGRKE